jgi:hypothetical protein
MDIRRRGHHCHPHRCTTIAIAVAAPPKPSLRRHRHHCAATFSAIAAPHRCAPSLRRHHCTATTIAAQPPPPPSLHDHNKHTGLLIAR